MGPALSLSYTSPFHTRHVEKVGLLCLELTSGYANVHPEGTTILCFSSYNSTSSFVEHHHCSHQPLLHPQFLAVSRHLLAVSHHFEWNLIKCFLKVDKRKMWRPFFSENLSSICKMIKSGILYDLHFRESSLLLERGTSGFWKGEQKN